MEELQEFDRYMEHLSEGLGHVDRHPWLRGYCTGLMAPLKRKSVEPMAAYVDPEHVPSLHQSLHHFVAASKWSDEEMLRRVAQWVVPRMDFSDGGWWIVDDTGFPKQGRHSVGVGRQYCGVLGKQDNCQVAVSVSLACEKASLPAAWRLYLPQEWAEDAPRRAKAGVPEEVGFATKPAIALQQIERLLAQGAPRYGVLADAGYGVDTAFRERLSELGLRYVAGVTGSVTVWPPGHEPLPPKSYSGRGRMAQRLRLGQPGDAQHRPQSIKEVALALGPQHWSEIAWLEGTNTTLRSRFARLRVRAAHRDEGRSELRAPEWLLIEWPEGHDEPMKYWLSTLPEDTALQRLVYEAKMRWRIERDYQDLKQDVGLGHFEGRGWQGFHHHASLSIAAYGFLLAERLSHPESGDKKKSAPRQAPALPPPRGRPPSTASRRHIHHQPAAAHLPVAGTSPDEVPVLPAPANSTTRVTQ